MKEINVDLSLKRSIVEQIGDFLKGNIKKTYNECTLTFDNSIGKGIIRNITFEWGITLLDYKLHFNQETKIVFNISNVNPIEFFFVSEGKLSYASKRSGNDSKLTQLSRYQNIILSNLPNSNNIFIFPKNEKVELNVIQIFGNEYSNKANNHISTLQKSLKSIFKGKETYLPYEHLGNYNLKLADIVESLNTNDNDGIVRFLNIEGQLNLILALQILEHKSFETKLNLPNSLTNVDLAKTKEVSKYINENIQGTYTVADLATKHGFSPKKMQTGFKLLYRKSVNEYIRDRKLELSRELIESSEYSISEIVYQIGYKSRSYFSKIFFEKYDILPVDYRSLVRKRKITLEKE